MFEKPFQGNKKLAKTKTVWEIHFLNNTQKNASCSLRLEIASLLNIVGIIMKEKNSIK